MFTAELQFEAAFASCGPVTLSAAAMAKTPRPPAIPRVQTAERFFRMYIEPPSRSSISLVLSPQGEPSLVRTKAQLLSKW